MMKRRTLLLLLFASLFQLCFADKVDEGTAKEKALQFLSQRKVNAAKADGKKGSVSMELSLAQTEVCRGDVVYYAFNNADNGGFVVVSADDNVPSVLCYSDEGSFNLSKMSPEAKTMLKEYAQYITLAKQGKATALATTAQNSPIYPFIKSKWGQGNPYNRLCPGLTGCVATAFAQVMYYYRWPQTGVGSHTYMNGKNEISITYGEEYNYDQMLTKCESVSDKSTIDAVSKLMYHVGVAANMQYGKAESGAQVSEGLEGMIEHFRYDKGARVEYASNYESALWQALLYSELAQGRPVVYSGQSNEGGHAFILDGYENGYFHVNWGWEGNADGYFLLTKMLGYDDGQAACVGLKPVEEQTIVTDGQLRWGYCDETILAYSGGDGTIGGAIKIPATDLQAYKGKKIVGMEIGLANGVSGLSCFVSRKVDSNYLTQQSVGTGKVGWNKVELSAPIEIDGGDLYLGYTCNNVSGIYPVARSGREDWSDTYAGSTCYTLYNGVWELGSNIYSLCIRAIFEDVELPTDMRLCKVDNVSCNATDATCYITGTVESMTPGTVSNYTVAYQIGLDAVQYYTVDCNMKVNEMGRFSVPVSNSFGAGTHDLKVWIDKVNGKTDAVSSNSDYYKTHSVILKIHGKTFERRNVMESYISTACGYSPRAIIADRTFREKYPDTYIGINIHESFPWGTDPMSNPDHYGGYSTPTTFVNRSNTPNGNVNGLETAFADEADFDIVMEPFFSSVDKKTLNITSHVTPGMNVKGQYRIAYVITEDNVGPYEQENFLSNNPYFKWNEAQTIYDGVARGIYPYVDGSANSLPSTMTAGNTYEHTYNLTLPKNIVNVDNINVVALLINYATNEIENAYSIPPFIPGEKALRMTKHKVAILEGETAQLNVVGVGLTPTDQLEWSSSDSSIATVSTTGLVTGIKMGDATISVQVKNHPETKITCLVEVGVEKKWTFDQATGTLYVQGRGNMEFRAEDGIWDEFKDDIKHVVIAEGITSLVNYAFFDCSNVESVSLPSTLKAIGKNAFCYCSNLKEIVIPEGVESIGYGAFIDCKKLKKLVIPSSMKSIGTSFLNNSNISELYVNWASLDNIEIPSDAFKGVETSGVFLIVPKGSVDMYKKTEPWSGFIIRDTPPAEQKWNFDQATGTLYIEGEGKMEFRATDGIWDEFKDDIKHVVIAEGITSLQYEAFYYCRNIESVSLPSTLKAVERYAFCACSHLKEVVIPEGVESISYGAFDDCTNLKKLVIPSSVKSIGASFLYYSNISELYVNWASLDNIEIPSNVFNGVQTSGVFLIVPKGSVDMYKQTEPWSGFIIRDTPPAEQKWNFDQTTGTLYIEGEGKMEFRAEDGIWDEFKDDIKHVVIAEGITSLVNYAFFDCSNVESASLPSTLKAVETNAFGWCSNLKEVVIPEGVESIGYGAFQVCSNLKKLVIPSSVKSIGDNFLSNSNISELYVNWTSFDNVEVSSDAFKGVETSGVFLIVPKGSVDMYKKTEPWSGFIIRDTPPAEQKWNFDQATGTLYIEGEGKMEFRATDGIWDEFKDDIKHIVIAEGITLLRYEAFFNCRNIESVSLPSTLKAIGTNAFCYCFNLKEVVIPEGVESIGYGAFQVCTNLKKLVIPSSVKSIGDSFLYYSNISELYVNWASLDNIEIPSDVFNGVETSGVFLIVPKGYVDMYKKTEPWSGFIIRDTPPAEQKWNFDQTTGTLYIEGEGKMEFRAEDGIWDEFKDDIKHVVIAEGITSLVNYAFFDCSNVESVSLPSTLKAVETNAFGWCSNLKEVVIPEGVESIGYGAFQVCSNLKKLVIPSSVKSIGSYALSYCHCLTDITCAAKTAPSLDVDAFNNISGTGVLTVPTGADYSNFLSVLPEGWSINYDESLGISPATISPADGPAYDLQGRRVTNFVPGHIYIINGKKVCK